ncbi:hypothetical protein BKI52_43015 [marine bacterium AO1-C]|nr:hypothetical protein BKI52_43015 [marine bacterium AO1-C]
MKTSAIYPRKRIYEQIILVLLASAIPLFSFFHDLKAQNNPAVPVLSHLPEHQKLDHLSIDSLYKLGLSEKFNHPVSSKYFSRGLQLALKHNDLLNIAQGHVHLGNLNLHYREFEAAQKHFRLGCKIAKQHRFYLQQVDCLNGLGPILIIHNEHQQALSNYHRALKMARNLRNQAKICHTICQIGDFHRLQKNYAHAHEYLQKALGYARDFQLPKQAYQALAKLGILYADQKKYQSLKQCGLDALKIAQRLNDQVILSRAYNLLGIAFFNLEQFDKAIHFYKKALDYKLLTNDFDRLVILYHNIAEVYRTTYQYEEAIDYFKKSLLYAQKRGDLLASGVMLRNIGEIYHLQKQYKTAEDYLKQSQAPFDQLKSFNELCTSYKLLAKNYEAAKNFEQAYFMHIKYKQAYDSIFNNQKSEIISKIEQRYKDEKKQEVISLLKKENKLQEQKAKLQRKLRNIALVGLGLLGIVLLLFFKHYKLRSKVLQQKSLLLEKENERHISESQRLAIEQKLKQEENKQLRLELDYKNQELATSTLLIHQKTSILGNIQQELKQFQQVDPNKWQVHLDNIQKIIKENTDLEQEWKRLKVHFDQVHPRFFNTLQQQYPHLSQYDLRLCAYIRINLTNKEIGRILGVGFRSIQVAKFRLKKKIGLEKSQDLSEFIQQV